MSTSNAHNYIFIVYPYLKMTQLYNIIVLLLVLILISPGSLNDIHLDHIFGWTAIPLHSLANGDRIQSLSEVKK